MYNPEHLQVGTAFIFFDDDCKPPHHKRCIIVGFTDDKTQFACVYINSDINVAALRSPDLEALHLPIAKTNDRKYLTKDSYIDCSSLIHLFSNSVCNSMNNKNGQVFQVVNSEDLNKIHHILINGGGISQYYLKTFNII